MKLRNKKTGEIIEVESLDVDTPIQGIVDIPSFDRKGSYYSLAELNEDWEDYEEPKEYWWISPVEQGVTCDKYTNDGVDEMNKKIGNYFETKEEAEKAIEKLKAWKRLKDKGFRFIDHIDRDSGQGMTRYKWDGYVNGEDLDLLFGGEEDGK